MIKHDPKSNDVHVFLNKDVEICQGENLIAFINSDQNKDGNRKVFLHVNNQQDLETLAQGVLEIKKHVQRIEIKKNKEKYISFSAQVRYGLQKPQRHP
jgi:hypothetical protein